MNWAITNDPDSIVGRQLVLDPAVSGLPDVTELPTDRPRPKAASYRGARVEFEIPAVIADGVSSLARARSSSFMVLHAALALLVAR